MLSDLKKSKPHLVVAVTLGAGGAAKLAGVPFEKNQFKRWGYADWWLPAIGAAEVVSAAAVIAGLNNETAAKLGAAGTMTIMGGAVATHVMAKEPLPLAVPAAILAALGFATLFRTPAESPDEIPHAS